MNKGFIHEFLRMADLIFIHNSLLNFFYQKFLLITLFPQEHLKTFQSSIRKLSKSAKSCKQPTLCLNCPQHLWVEFLWLKSRAELRPFRQT